MRAARREGYHLIKKFIRDHDLPLFTERPRWCMEPRSGREIFSGTAQYRCHAVARGFAGCHNSFSRMRYGRIACIPPPLPLTSLEAVFDEISMIGGFEIGSLGSCTVFYLAQALVNFIENEILSTSLQPDEYSPPLHITVHK